MMHFYIPWFILNTLFSISSEYTPSNNKVTLSNEQIIPAQPYVMQPIWSPDDSKLLLSGEGYKGIFVYSFADKQLSQLTNLNGTGYRPSWSPDGKDIYFRYKDQFEKNAQYKTHNVNLDGSKKNLGQHIDPFSLFTDVDTKKSNDISIVYNRKTLQVEGKFKNNTDTWLITSGKGAFYHPVLSPNRKLLLVHSTSQMYVYATDGSGLIAELGNGLGNTWSPDSKHILFTIEESKDGHAIDNAELYCADLLSNRSQLTNTKNRIESWPDWSNDGTRIAYTDLASGELIIAQIEIK